MKTPQKQKQRGRPTAKGSARKGGRGRESQGTESDSGHGGDEAAEDPRGTSEKRKAPKVQTAAQGKKSRKTSTPKKKKGKGVKANKKSRKKTSTKKKKKKATLPSPRTVDSEESDSDPKFHVLLRTCTPGSKESLAQQARVVRNANVAIELTAAEEAVDECTQDMENVRSDDVAAIRAVKEKWITAFAAYEVALDALRPPLPLPLPLSRRPRLRPVALFL